MRYSQPEKTKNLFDNSEVIIPEPAKNSEISKWCNGRSSCENIGEKSPKSSSRACDKQNWVVYHKLDDDESFLDMLLAST